MNYGKVAVFRHCERIASSGFELRCMIVNIEDIHLKQCSVVASFSFDCINWYCVMIAFFAIQCTFQSYHSMWIDGEFIIANSRRDGICNVAACYKNKNGKVYEQNKMFWRPEKQTILAILFIYGIEAKKSDFDNHIKRIITINHHFINIDNLSRTTK